MAETTVKATRFTQRELWLISCLKPEYSGQPLSQRLRNLVLDAAGAELRIQVDKTGNCDRRIILPKGLKLPKGQEPVPRKWPIV